MPISAVDSVSPALEHTKDQLFRPFRLGQWTRMALVGLLAGELGSSGGSNFHAPNLPAGHHHNFSAFPHWDPAIVVPFVVAGLIVAPVVWLLFLYISSRMRFVLFDSVLERRCEVRRMWRERRAPALKYFGWQIVFHLVTFAGVVYLVGVPAFIAFLLGWFSAWREHLAGLVLAGVIVFTLLSAWLLLSLLVHVFTKDFVVPQMALENISAFTAWGKLMKIVDSERPRFIGYAGMKVLLSIAAAFAVGIIALILVLVMLIPVGGVGILSGLAAQAAGISWNVFTITVVVMAACVVLAILFYVISLVSVPVIVFFPAFSMHFFAARYPLLARVIYPAPPVPPVPPMPAPA